MKRETQRKYLNSRFTNLYSIWSISATFTRFNSPTTRTKIESILTIELISFCDGHIQIARSFRAPANFVSLFGPSPPSPRLVCHFGFGPLSWFSRIPLLRVTLYQVSDIFLKQIEKASFSPHFNIFLMQSIQSSLSFHKIDVFTCVCIYLDK